MLVAEEAPGPPHAGLHLVDDQKRALSPARGLDCPPVGLGGQVDPLALDRLDHEGGDVAPLQLPVESLDVPEGHRVAVGKQRAEALSELLAPVEGERSVGQAVEGVVAVEDPIALGGAPRELDGRLHRLGPRVGEEDPLDAGRSPPHQRFGQQTGKQSAVQLGEIGQIGIQRLVERVLDHRVAPAEGEDPEAGQEVEVPVTVVVDQVRALGAHVVPIEPQRGQHPDQLRIHEAGVQFEALALVICQ